MRKNPKIDHRISDNHTIGLRLNASRKTNNNVNDRITFNSQAAQQALPGTAVLGATQAFGIQVNDNYVINSNIVNEFRVSYTNALPSDSQPVTPSIVIIRPGISTDGNGSFGKVRLQNAQIVNQMSVQFGRHSLKFGGDYTRQTLRDVSYQQFGTYTLGATPTAANPQGISRFTQQVAAEDLRYGQTRFAAFMQDDWRFNSQLTFNLGLRYDYQSLIDDYNNFGPRLGFAYDVGGKGDTVIRGGAGMYYDQPFFHGFTQRYLLNGPTAARGTIELTGAAAAAFFPNSFDPRSPVPQTARRSLFLKGDDLTSPYTLQFSLGVQRKLFGDWVANADVIHSFSRGLLTAFNRNAPSPFPRTEFGQIRGGGTIANAQALANATRPFNTFQGVPVTDVLVSTNAGNANYDALILGVTKRFGNRFTFAANYVLSSSIDSITDDHLGANPNEFSDVVGAERAQTDFNQRHRFVSYGTVALPYRSQFSLVATIASGIRINPITGVDNNGDGRTVDRPAGFERNSFVGRGQTRFDASLSKSFRVNMINESARFEIRADVFNLFNNSNFYRFNNVYGNGAIPISTFGQPIGGISNVDPGRQIQFTARFVF
ncbi:MAG TPA: TonB-dependent receptor [Pyrinomonadaceae bacterium]|nr:TonB-dependent receptor [Pyrinomonadaceae bacterium]